MIDTVIGHSIEELLTAATKGNLSHLTLSDPIDLQESSIIPTGTALLWDSVNNKLVESIKFKV